MATSRTGTAKYKNNRRRALHNAQAQGITHCPRCKILLDYQAGRRPNSAEADHNIPHSRGGTDDIDNLTVLCRRCNQQVGAKTGPRTHPKGHSTVQSIDFTQAR